MAQKRYTHNVRRKNNANKDVVGVVLIIVSAFLLINLIVPNIFGRYITQAIKSLLHGFLGFSVYPFLASTFMLGVAFVQQKRLSVKPKYVAGVVIISTLIIMILHLATSRTYLLEGSFGGYISAVYKNFTGGGVFFGVFVYGIQAVLTEVFSYVLFSLLIILTGYLMARDKLGLEHQSSSQGKKHSSNQKTSFTKGIRPALEVQPIKDTKLYIGTIQPAKPYSASGGSFNTMPQKQNKNMQSYSSEEFDEEAEEKKQKAIKFMNYIKQTPPVFESEKPVDKSEILPTKAQASPDIHSSQVEPVQPEANKKPPKILHFDEVGLPKINLPPPLELPEIQNENIPIINGAELSRRIAEERNLTISKTTSYDEFDKRKIEPTQAVPKSEQVSEASTLFTRTQEEEIPLAPIINGELFASERAATQSPQRKGDNLNTNTTKPPSDDTRRRSFAIGEYSHNYDEPQAGLQANVDTREIEDADSQEFNPDNLLKNILKLEGIKQLTDIKNRTDHSDIAPNMSSPDSEYDDDYVEDLSERDLSTGQDNSGYYTEVVEEKKSVKPIPQLQKIRPENQIGLGEYAQSIAQPVKKPKVKKPIIKYVPPPLVLLNDSEINLDETIQLESSEKAKILESTLNDLKLPVNVTAIIRGPAVTRYELDMPPGIPVKKIEQFTKDIEYHLASNGHIRIETPIPGKRAVGIEVPNALVDIVRLKEIISSKEFVNSSSPTTLALGKDIAGANIVATLEKMTHLLIAGSTGSGKSACLNSIIISLLYKASPDDVRLILIDPKQVEFATFKNLPHLLTNEIITDSNQALNAFKWIKQEMERRYTLFSQHIVRDIGEYNKLDVVKDGEEEKLPRIVLIVDELAELMMSANRKDLEEKIMSMSQKARAAGIHLILATQRPSVDIITGTIKSNLPSRIAFAVKSNIDSRTILDNGGAETLLGRGDMLYAPAGTDVVRRIQGAYVDSAEVACVANHVREYNSSFGFDEDFKSALTVKEDAVSEETASEEESEFDPLMAQVLKLLIETGTVSTTFLQRRFAIGYARAARIMDQMEVNNFVGPMENGKPRAVCITREQYREIFGDE